MRETKITNPGERYHRASLIEPSHSGYVHIAAQIDPPARPARPAQRAPGTRRSRGSASSGHG